MTETSLTEVLRSPLDDMPERRTVPAWLVFAIAAALGTVVGVLVADGGDTPTAAPTTVPAETTTTAPAPESPDLEVGGATIEQLGWWQQGDRVEVVLAAVARPGDEVDPIGTAAWEVELADGR
ncbi:MAG: hypothetical protein R3290_05435, partial [Acidimicrobiia bacterium]|nr:hypothetical protein [Acidimicrobiia bacterium]